MDKSLQLRMFASCNFVKLGVEAIDNCRIQSMPLKYDQHDLVQDRAQVIGRTVGNIRKPDGASASRSYIREHFHELQNAHDLNLLNIDRRLDGINVDTLRI